MSRLYLRCVVCSRQQADGLISGAAWGRLELPAGLEVEHPALKGSTFRCCPTCIERHPGWEEELLTSLGVSRNGRRPHAGAGPTTGDYDRPPEGA
jgi:hypothetical protein